MTTEWKVPEELKHKAPFPWFGGKSRAATLVWNGLGDVGHYIEPFAGSLAVLLNRPSEPKTETVCDTNALLVNAWRAMQWDPDGVVHWCDWPVSECDINARHKWLVTTGAERVELCQRDPEFYDVKVAGWWLYGVCTWIGGGWCRNAGQARPMSRQLPSLGGSRGVHRKLPHLSGGQGLNRKLPNVDGEGTISRLEYLHGYLRALADRLRDVRMTCGDWRRVLTPSVAEKTGGVTGIFFDPPYSADGTDYEYAYHDRSENVSAAVREWAIANGGNPKFRIALCGYEGEHQMPDTWKCVAWRARKGYGKVKADGTHNGHRERIWFSPHCLNNT